MNGACERSSVLIGAPKKTSSVAKMHSYKITNLNGLINLCLHTFVVRKISSIKYIFEKKLIVV